MPLTWAYGHFYLILGRDENPNPGTHATPWQGTPATPEMGSGRTAYPVEEGCSSLPRMDR